MAEKTEPLAKWDPPYDPEFSNRVGEAQRWSLAILMKGDYYQYFGTIEKPYGVDLYYVGRAPPTEKDLIDEQKASDDGLLVCWHNTEKFRATCEFTSYATLEEAKKVCLVRARESESVRMGQELTKHNRFLEGVIKLELEQIK